MQQDAPGETPGTPRREERQRPKRPYRKIEKRLVSDFVRERFPGASIWDRPRLGPYKSPTHGTLEERAKQAFQFVKQRWADAVVFTGADLYIIEGKLIADARTAGQLEHYRELIRETPEYEIYEGAPVRLMVVAYQIPDDVEAFLKRRGIETEEYKPDWAEKYFEERKYR